MRCVDRRWSFLWQRRRYHRHSAPTSMILSLECQFEVSLTHGEWLEKLFDGLASAGWFDAGLRLTSGRRTVASVSTPTEATVEVRRLASRRGDAHAGLEQMFG